VTAADYQAVAEWVGALAALIGVGVLGWAKGLPAALASWSRVRMRRATSLLFSREVAALPSSEFNPEVSLEAGIAYARQAARSGHPPYTVTQGRVSAGQPLDYLLGKVCETVWEAVSSAQSELEPYLVPLRNYLGALTAKAAGPQRVTSPWASSPSGRGRKKTAGPTSPARSKNAPGAARLTGIPAATCASWSASTR